MRLHLFNDTVFDNVTDHDVDDPESFVHGEEPTHILAEIGPLDRVHLIEFRDDGWTIQHTLTERIDGTLFDCPLSNWTGGDPGVRGRFVLEADGSLSPLPGTAGGES